MFCHYSHRFQRIIVNTLSEGKISFLLQFDRNIYNLISFCASKLLPTQPTLPRSWCCTHLSHPSIVWMTWLRKQRLNMAFSKMVILNICLKTSSNLQLTKMWRTMKLRDTLVANSTEGINRVRKGRYAFISDSSILEYQAQRKPCQTLTTVGR